MAQDERLKRNLLLGALSVAGTASAVVWWLIYSQRQQAEIALSAGASAMPAEAMLAASGISPAAGRVSVPMPPLTSSRAEPLASNGSAAARAALRRVDMGERVGHGEQRSDAASQDVSGGAGGTEFPSLGQGQRWELTAGDVAALRRSVGRGDAATLGRVAGNNKELFPALDGLMNDPRALHWLLSNPAVVKKFMERKSMRDSCADARALARSLSDAADESGLRGYFKALAKSVGVPGSTIAMVDSKIHQELWSSCPSFTHLSQDPQLVMGVIKSAPEFMSVMANPAFATALQTSPR